MAGQLGGQAAVEAPALGREEVDGRFRRGPHGFDRGVKRLRLENHALLAAERTVVDLQVFVGRKIPQIVHLDLEKPFLERFLDDSPVEDVGKHLGEDRDYIKSHLSPKGRPAGRRRSARPPCRSPDKRPR